MNKLVGFLLLATGVSAEASPYPASCFPVRGLPLPEPAASEPMVRSGTIDLRASGAPTSSNYAFVVYRVACPGGGSAVLVDFSPLQSPSGVFPKVSAVQGSTVLSSVPITREPFTQVEGASAGRDHVGLGQPVLINSASIDYDAAFTLLLQESFLDGRTISIEVPAFDPALYAASSAPLPIAGYLSGLYFNPSTPGEGIQVEIDATESIILTWFTYGPDGEPLWLFGNGPVCPSAVCVLPPVFSRVTLFAYRGGGFDSTFDPSALEATRWGDIRVEWRRCDALNFTLTPSHSDPRLPTASGDRTWNRLTYIQGRGC